MISIHKITKENFDISSLDTFDRSQQVENVYRVSDGTLTLVRSPFFETWSPERRREKAAEILSGDYITYCAFDGDRIAGEIMLIPETDHGRLIVDSLHVSREHRHTGLGRRLIYAAKTEALRKNAHALYMSACSAEETIRFYMAMGCVLSPDPIRSYAEDEPCDLQLELPVAWDKTPVLETERLYLRRMCPDDHSALYAVLSDSAITKHYPYTFDDARVRNWIDKNIDRYVREGFGLWAVCLKDTDEMIGDCGLTLQCINGRTLPEIGYHIRADRQRRGYAREAAAAVRDAGFTRTDFPALYSYCKYTNVPSFRTAESIGMRFCEEYPDADNGITHVSVITREEWEAFRGKA